MNALAVIGMAGVSLTASGCAGRPDGSNHAAEQGQVAVGRAAAATSGMPSVILLKPLSGPANPVPTTLAIMDQFGIAFIPQLLVARVGQPVEFRNSEDVDHNVRVVRTTTDSTLFNVVTPMGDPHTHTFEEPGGYAVACDIHPGMTAFVLVVTAPYAVVAARDGSFSFTDVPAGSYTLTVWNADPQHRLERMVEIAEGHTELILDMGNANAFEER